MSNYWTLKVKLTGPEMVRIVQDWASGGKGFLGLFRRSRQRLYEPLSSRHTRPDQIFAGLGFCLRRRSFDPLRSPDSNRGRHREPAPLALADVRVLASAFCVGGWLRSDSDGRVFFTPAKQNVGLHWRPRARKPG